MSKYNRKIIGFCGTQVEVDVYSVLDAFNVTDPCLQHLIKKALACGIRGHKNPEEDLTDIVASAHRAVQLHMLKERNK